VAKIVVEKFGDDAAVHAAMNADSLLDKGDVDERAAWLWILKNIQELQRENPGR
jgi:hypothetical protein